jgi:serine/threonine-protein kinase
MLTDAEKRAAALAVSRYGADRQRVQSAYQAVLQAQARGETADLVDLLVRQQLLTAEQARELRNGLDVTQVDPGAPPRSRPVPTVPGQELRSLGKYRLLRRLGEGGMGEVYLAYHEGQNDQYAIKVLAEHLASSPSYVDRFYREARSGSLLNHPNIVHCITAGQDRATRKFYLVLEYVDGPSAHALLQQYGRLSVADAVHVTLDVARALEHAHSRNIIHRDIKPDNILLTRSGLAKLADLGLSKRTDEASHLTAARQGFGTPYYMPYEQATNAKSADGRSDIYALGATLYHLVTGEVPFPGANHLEVVDKKEHGAFPPASALNPDVPPALDRILGRMMARNPRDRYQTASELIVDLERSRLASAVPSFVDPDLALQDPTVRARLTAPAQPTRADMELPTGDKVPALNGNPDVWHLRYRSDSGRLCKARLTTQQIVQRLREGRIPPEAEACRAVADGYKPLHGYPEFGLIEAPRRPAKDEAAPAANGNGKARDSGGDLAKARTLPNRPGVPARRLSWTLLLAVAGGLALLVALLCWLAHLLIGG